MRFAWRWAALRNGFLDATAYRVEFFFEVFGAAIVPAAIQWLLWYAMFKLGGAESVAGMSYHDMVMYTLTSILFTQIRGGDHDFELSELIRSGGLSNYLLRPAGVIEFVWLRGIAPKLFIAALALVIGMIAGAFFGLNPLRMLGAMFLALIGNIIYYQFSASLASAAFYWEEAYSILMVKNMVVQLLSGELIPLNLIPESWSWVWKYTPFYLFVYGPSQYALGKWSHLDFVRELGFAGLWIIAMYALIQLTWGLGTKRYLSLGG